MVSVAAMAVCVAMACVGAAGLDDCPAEPMVPKYLLGKSLITKINYVIVAVYCECKTRLGAIPS